MDLEAVVMTSRRKELPTLHILVECQVHVGILANHGNKNHRKEWGIVEQR